MVISAVVGAVAGVALALAVEAEGAPALATVSVVETFAPRRTMKYVLRFFTSCPPTAPADSVGCSTSARQKCRLPFLPERSLRART